MANGRARHRRHRNRNLTRIYDKYVEKPGFSHWMEYAEHYQANIKHLFRLPDLHIHVLEIGVQSGGSTRVWRKYFGSRLQYTGIDLNPVCKRFEQPTDNIKIEIGSQTNRTFLQEICTKYGPFHLIVDDGFHSTETILTSLDVLWTCLRDRGVYAIEDLHTMTMWRDRENMLVDGKDVYGHLADKLRLMQEYYYGALRDKIKPPEDKFALHLSGAQFYDSLAFLHYRKEWKRLTKFTRGREFIPYNVKVIPRALPTAAVSNQSSHPAKAG